MPVDAGPGRTNLRALRPGSKPATAVAALLLVGGGAAMAVGLLDQDADPSSPLTRSAEPAQTSAAESLSVPAESSAGPTTPTPRATAAPEPRIPPVEIRIPSIGVVSDVSVVGLNPDGTLEVPQPGPDYDKAAWYEGSPSPGQIGPSIIEGHVDSAENGPSVFYDLGKLSTGDLIEVTREDGSVVTFVVDEVKAFPKDDFPTIAVYGNTDRPEVRLITCGGQFDSASGHYVNNTVVFAHQT